VKKKIKGEILERRRSHAHGERVEKSAQIMKRLFELEEFKRAKTVLFYASKSDEVQTLGMIEEALALGKRVAVPITIVEGRNLALGEIRSVKALAPGAFNVPEPVEYVPVNPNLVDLVVVPGVAFDERGDRIGHGMGYYDKLLGQMHMGAKFVGLAFELQIVDDVPEERHDIRVHKIVTEKRVIGCERKKD